MNSWPLLCLVAALGGFVQGLSGFGLALIALPLFCLFLPIKIVIPLISLLAFCVNVYLAFDLRRHIRLRRIAPLLAATLPGIAVGVCTLKIVPAQWLEILMGSVLMLFALHSLLVTPRRAERNALWALPAGFLSGVLGGSIGAPGPPVILYASLQAWPKDEIKASLAEFFLLNGLVICSTQAASGLTTPEVLRFLAMALPALVVGMFAGIAAYRRLGDKQYRRIVFGALLLLGGMLLIRAL